MDYKISAKRKDTGKWWQFGSIKEGKYGPQLSFKMTQELRDHIDQSGEWLNFALFEAKPKEPERDLNETAEPIDDFGAPF